MAYISGGDTQVLERKKPHNLTSRVSCFNQNRKHKKNIGSDNSYGEQTNKNIKEMNKI